MVAKTIKLPNIRKMFLPDPGYVIVDADLERADAQVVAWDAEDEELKKIFRSGADIHTENAKAIFKTASPTPAQRQKAKGGVHAVNYGVKAKTLAAQLEISIYEAQEFIDLWLHAHPPIRRWHERIENQLMMTRQVQNAWGFRRFYFDRIEHLLPEALAWIGQSTVGITINKAMLNIHRNLPEVQLLLQVHDSLVMQVPEKLCPAIFPEIQSQMRISIPYPDPLTIPVSIKYSEKSWGDLRDWKPNGKKAA